MQDQATSPNKFKILLNNTRTFLKKKRDSLFGEKEGIKPDYSSLSPIDSGKDDDQYMQALNWALKNRKAQDIKNIALTGPYGSGKSSILKTFQKRHKVRGLKFLNISLATFKEEKIKKDSEGKKVEIDKTDLLRRIEISILEQIFYHENDAKIPDSRFKKIKSFGFWTLAGYSIAYLLFFLAIGNYFYPYLIQGIFKDKPFSLLFCDLLHYGSFAVIALGVMIIIYRSVRILNTLTLNKLNIQNAEIGIGSNQAKSVLNQHIDELLYFFSVRPYNVVIFEDLDRFQQTEIFTKLRELNLLLNSSKRTRRREVVFIYAVRDDIFKHGERTKFFDFIVPVIPVINASNSNEILLRKKKTFSYNLTPSFISDVSYYITEMRLLHNISNEFYLYKNSLSDKLSQDKLFAIIMYKNLYPTDFVKLMNYQGKLVNVLESKNSIIISSLTKLDTKISENEKEISRLNDINLKSVGDLRKLYILWALESTKNFKSFIINNEPVTIEELADNVNFDYLKTNKLQYQTGVMNYNWNREDLRVDSIPTTFTNIEKKVDPSNSYAIREKELFDKIGNRQNLLKEENRNYEREKIRVRGLKIAEVIKYYPDFTLEIDKGLDKDMVSLLIRNGYIAEDYIDYISLFHEGNITRNDHQFIIGSKNLVRYEFDYALNNIEQVVAKINPQDFSSKYVFNYSVLDFLLQYKDNYPTPLENMLRAVADESEDSIRFFASYFEHSADPDYFIYSIAPYWSNLWNKIQSSSLLTETNVKSLYRTILRSTTIDDIVAIASKSNLKNLILQDKDFLSPGQDERHIETLIEKLGLKVRTLKFEDSSDTLLRYIYDNNAYELNPEIISGIMRKFGKFDHATFNTSNFAAIRKSEAIILIKYVNSSIDEYVDSCYLQIQENVKEEPDALVELLNSGLDMDYITAILEKTETIIPVLAEIDDKEIYDLLLENNAVAPTWENLLYRYQTNMDDNVEDDAFTPSEIPESIISFIDHLPNAESLSKYKMPQKVNDKNIFGAFCKQLMQCEDISEEAFDLISKSSSWRYSDLKIENMSHEKVTSLIMNTVIENSKAAYDSLKQHFTSLHIKLFENRKEAFFKLLPALDFDGKDLLLTLKSTVFNNSDKVTLIKTTPDDKILSEKANLPLLLSLQLTEPGLKFSHAVQFAISSSNLVPTADRIRLFNAYSGKFSPDEVETFLQNLGGDFAKINSRTTTYLQDNDNNHILVKRLQDLGIISSATFKEKGLKINYKRAK